MGFKLVRNVYRLLKCGIIFSLVIIPFYPHIHDISTVKCIPPFYQYMISNK